MNVENRFTLSFDKSQIKWRFEAGVLLLVTPVLLFPPAQISWVVGAVGLLLGVWLLVWWRGGVFWPMMPFGPAFVPFVLAVAMGGAITIVPALTIPKAAGIVLGMAWWRLFAVSIGSEKGVLMGVGWTILVGLGFAGLGFLSADWMNKIPWLQTAFNQLPTPILGVTNANPVHTNQLAGTILLFWPLLLALTWRLPNHYRRLRPVLILVTVGITLLLLLTQSRSGWFGGLLGVLTLVLLHCLSQPALRQTGWIILCLVLSLGMIVVVSVDWAVVWNEPPNSTVLGSFSTLTFRQSVWRWGLVAVGDFPFTGMGLGTFRQVARTLYPIDAPISVDIAHAHNVFLQVALDIGLIGLAAYIGLVAVALRICWRVLVGDSAENNPAQQISQAVALGIAASLIAFHVYGLTDTIALGAKTGLSFWLLLGLAAGLYRLSQE